MGDDADEETSTTFLQQIFDLWVEPEFQRRLQAFNPADVSKVLVIMPPGRPVEVRLNDEAVLVANVRVTRAIDAGETVTTDDVDEMHDLRPHEVDPDAGWESFVRVGQQVVISFDSPGRPGCPSRSGPPISWELADAADREALAMVTEERLREPGSWVLDAAIQAPERAWVDLVLQRYRRALGGASATFAEVATVLDSGDTELTI